MRYHVQLTVTARTINGVIHNDTITKFTGQDPEQNRKDAFALHDRLTNQYLRKGKTGLIDQLTGKAIASDQVDTFNCKVALSFPEIILIPRNAEARIMRMIKKHNQLVNENIRPIELLHPNHFGFTISGGDDSGRQIETLIINQSKVLQ